MPSDTSLNDHDSVSKNKSAGHDATHTQTSSVDIKSLSIGELVLLFKKLGQPTYRAEQVLNWVYKKCASNWESMTDLPLTLRRQMAERYVVSSLECVRVSEAADGTVKFLWRLPDKNLIESVLIPANLDRLGQRGDRITVCISSQVGCAWHCRFCASGIGGLKRNLFPHEIVEQVIGIERWCRENPSWVTAVRRFNGFIENSGRRKPIERFVDNVVVMGMGEPLDNYENVMTALKTLNAPWGMNIGARHITISTCGIAPQIKRLAHEPYQFELAVSLHATSDKIRNMLMPVNKKYPIRELIEACKYYQRVKGRIITFEYLLLSGINDSERDGQALVQLIQNIRCKVNVIPYNPVQGLKWCRPSDETINLFIKTLKKHGINATLRQQKGVDIDAACGQLRLRTMVEADTGKHQPSSRTTA